MNEKKNKMKLYLFVYCNFLIILFIIFGFLKPFNFRLNTYNNYIFLISLAISSIIIRINIFLKKYIYDMIKVEKSSEFDILYLIFGKLFSNIIIYFLINLIVNIFLNNFSNNEIIIHVITYILLQISILIILICLIKNIIKYLIKEDIVVIIILLVVSFILGWLDINKWEVIPLMIVVINQLTEYEKIIKIINKKYPGNRFSNLSCDELDYHIYKFKLIMNIGLVFLFIFISIVDKYNIYIFNILYMILPQIYETVQEIPILIQFIIRGLDRVITIITISIILILTYKKLLFKYIRAFMNKLMYSHKN